MPELCVEAIDQERLEDALAIRHAVFMEEQAVPYELEIDGLDPEATHFIGTIAGEAVATARTRQVQEGVAKIERVAVLQEHRGGGNGGSLMQYIIASAASEGLAKLVLESQTHARHFYERLGFSAVGEEFMDAGIPHVKMVHILDEEKAAALGPDKLSYTLSAEENRVLQDFYRTALTEHHNQDASWLAFHLKEHSPLPPVMAEQIIAFGRDGNDIGAFLIQGLDMPYPIDSFEGKRYAEYLLLSVATRSGLPYGLEGQNDGAIISDIVPRQSDAQSQLGTGAVDGLLWHTEDAHTTYNCDIIALYDMRGDPDVKTLVSQVDPNLLPSPLVEELRQPNFHIFADDSHNARNGITTAVLDASENGPKLRYDPLYTWAGTLAAGAALSQLTEWINDNYRTFALNSRDMLLIDNRTSVHARSGIRPRYDGTDRWLKRLRIHRNNVPEEQLVAGRPLVINF